MPPTQEKYRTTLHALATFLAKPRTVREVCKRFKCSKPGAYKRLAALRRAGYVLQQAPLFVREKITGPRARPWLITARIGSDESPANSGNRGTKTGAGSARARS